MRLVVWFGADPRGVIAAGQVQAPVNNNGRASRFVGCCASRGTSPAPSRLNRASCVVSVPVRDTSTTISARPGQDLIMRQPSSRDLFAYWDALRGTRPAPDRSEIDPGAIRASLPDVFLLGLDPARSYPFRLAGMSVCALFGRELRDSAFTALWTPTAAPAIAKLVQCVIDDCIGAVTAITGQNETGQTLELELLLLPLTCRDGERARVIGALSTASPPYWLGIRPVQTLEDGDVRFVGPAVDGAGRKFVAGRANLLKGPGFVVYPAMPRLPNSTKSAGLTDR